MKNVSRLCAAAAILFNFSSMAAAATLDGQTVQIDLRFPDLATVSQTSGPVVVGPGVEAIFNPYSVDVSGNFLIVVLGAFGGASTFFDSAFNGLVLNDIFDSFGDFSSASLTTFLIDGGSAQLSFDANNIFLDFAGVSVANQAGNQTIARVDFTVDDTMPAVPLPASMVFLIAGLGAMGLARRMG